MKLEMYRQLTIGADPEIFLKKDGKFITAAGIIPGDKTYPHPVRYYNKDGYNKRGAVQLDGTSAEFNIPTCATADDFTDGIVKMLGVIQEYASKHKAELAIVPVADFEVEYFNQLPASQKELGCDPDFNAWVFEKNKIPEGDRPFRTGSGHVHIGLNLPRVLAELQNTGYRAGNLSEWDGIRYDNHFEFQCALARQLDYTLGLPSLLWDGDNRRRELYGKSGAFRPKNYGLEYRVLSNAWLADPKRTKFVYDNTVKGINDFYKGIQYENTFDDLAQKLIDDNVTDWPTKYPDLAKAINHKGF